MNPDLLSQLPADLFPGVIYLYDLRDQGNFYMNSKLEEILGYTKEDLQGMEQQLIATIIHPDDKSKVEELMKELGEVETGMTVRTQYRLKDKSGKWRWFQDSACVSQTDEFGNTVQIVGSALEITNLHDARRNEKRMLALFQILLEHLPEAVSWKNREGIYLGYNKKFLDFAGLKPGTDLLGHTDAEVGVKSLPGEEASSQRVFEKKEVESELVETKGADGAPFILEVRRVPIPGGEGKDVVGVLTTHRDITAERVLPDHIRELEQRLRLTIETTSEAVFILEPEGCELVEVNKPATTLLGQSRDALLGKALADFLEPEEREVVLAWLNEEGEAEPRELSLGGGRLALASRHHFELGGEPHIRFNVVEVTAVVERERVQAKEREADLDQGARSRVEQAEESARKALAEAQANQQAELGRLQDASQSKLEALESRLKEESEVLAQARAELESTRTELEQQVRERSEVEARQQELEEDLRLLESELEEARSQSAAVEAQGQSAREQLEGQLSALRESMNSRQAQEARLKTELERASNRHLFSPVPYLELDGRGRVTKLGEAAIHLFGYEEEDVLGEFFDKILIHRRDRLRVEEEIQRWLENGEGGRLSVEALPRDRRRLLLEWYAQPIKTEDGNALSCYLFDVTEIRELEERSREGELRYRFLFEAFSEPLVSLEPEGLRFVEANSAAETFLGHNRRNLLRMGLSELLIVKRETIDEALATDKPSTLRLLERVEDEERPARQVEVCFSGAKNAEGEDRVVLLLRDVSDEQQQLDALLAREQDSRAALEACQQAVWVWDVRSGEVHYSDSWAAVLGVEPVENTDAREAFFKLVHLEDLAALKELFEVTQPDEDAPMQAEIRIRSKQGGYRWMLVRVNRRFNEDCHLERLVGACFDLTDWKEAIRTQQTAREAAEAASDAKSTFLANMTHEIRTPLNAILGFCELLKETTLNVDQKDYVQKLNASGDTLLELLNNLLDLTKVESGRMQIENAYVDPKTFLEEIVFLFSGQAREKGIRVSFDPDRNLPPSILTDPTRLRQICLNILSNAFKFTHAGEVRVSVGLSEVISSELATLCIRISDTGIGIARERQETIFEKFSQVGHPLTRKYGGTGLGLAISQSLAQLLGGSIELESEPEEGSTFTIFVTVGVSASPATISARSGSNPFRRGLRDRRPLDVLLVEDNRLNQQVIIAAFDHIGHRLDVAGSGEEALEFLNRKRYDLVLMDIQMPGMDGLECTRLIRTRFSPENQPYIVAVTAAVLESDRKACLEAGMDDYLSKPVKKEALERAIQPAYLRRV